MERFPLWSVQRNQQGLEVVDVSHLDQRVISRAFVFPEFFFQSSTFSFKQNAENMKLQICQFQVTRSGSDKDQWSRYEQKLRGKAHEDTFKFFTNPRTCHWCHFTYFPTSLSFRQVPSLDSPDLYCSTPLPSFRPAENWPVYLRNTVINWRPEHGSIIFQEIIIFPKRFSPSQIVATQK